MSFGWKIKKTLAPCDCPCSYQEESHPCTPSASPPLLLLALAHPRPPRLPPPPPPLPPTPPLSTIPPEPAKESPHPPSISLWPNGAPGSETKKDEPEKVDWRDNTEAHAVYPVTYNIHNPSITPYLPSKEKANGTAIIVAPGGGHQYLTMDREGYEVGQWLADRGVAGFVLKSRLAKDKAAVDKGTTSPYQVEVESLQDFQRAIRLVRSRAVEWNIDPHRIGAMGFSAGGQLALLASTRYDNGKTYSSDPIDRQSCKPDFQIDVYPAIPTDLKIDDQTPPAFLCGASDDKITAGLADLYQSLRKAGVKSELHLYSTGGHGFGLWIRPMAVTSWTDRLNDWMTDMGYMKKQ